MSLFLIAGAFVTILPLQADAPPSIPEILYGSVTNNGSSVGAGFTVEARINGVAVTVGTTDSQGRYGYSTQFPVACSSGSISMYVNGVQATTLSCTAGATKLNLSVTGAPASYTAPTIASTSVSITTTSLSGGTVGTAYSATLAASGGTSPYTWSVSSGTLPAGLTLSSGVISGTPTTAATSTFTLQAADSASHTASATLSITISASASSSVSVNTYSIPGGTVGTSYSAFLIATGGSGSYTWSVSSGSLPAGLSLSSAGVISGTPTAVGTYSFTVLLADTASHTSSIAYSVTIGAAAATTTTTTTTTPITTTSSTSSSSSSSGSSTSSSTGSSSSQPSATPASSLAAFSISNMTATPISSKSGNQVTVSINVANTGKATGTKSLLLKINDNVEAQQDVVLDPGESQVVTFTVNNNTPGTYKASIDPLSADFVITSAPATQQATQQSNDSGVPVVGIFIGGFLLVFLIILLIIRQRRQSNY
ncbi:MAG: putative Ig domain-containing protein [Dehalococcoidia bacterium]